MQRKPVVGKIVHYHRETLSLPLAALITETFLDGTASLAVFTGRTTRRGRAETESMRGVPFSEKPMGGRWSWPPDDLESGQ